MTRMRDLQRETVNSAKSGRTQQLLQAVRVKGSERKCTQKCRTENARVVTAEKQAKQQNETVHHPRREVLYDVKTEKHLHRMQRGR